MIEDAEIVAEVVEKVATVAEKVSAQVADELPDDSKLKEAALFVEHVSGVTAQDAHLTENFIHKVFVSSSSHLLLSLMKYHMLATG